FGAPSTPSSSTTCRNIWCAQEPERRAKPYLSLVEVNPAFDAIVTGYPLARESLHCSTLVIFVTVLIKCSLAYGSKELGVPLRPQSRALLPLYLVRSS